MIRSLRVIATGAVFATTIPVLAGHAPSRKLTLDDIYDPEKKVDVGAGVATGLVWIDASTYAWPKTDPKNSETEWLRVEADTGKTTRLFDPEKMQAALENVAKLKPDEARRVARGRDLAFDPTYSAAVVTVAEDLYLHDFREGTLRRLTEAKGTEELATFSPSAGRIAFFRDGNLFVVDRATGAERPLTTDGSATLQNGKLDWVYQEEVYGRGNYRAFWWSPDSSRIAFLQLDETHVPHFTLEDHIPYRLKVEQWPYPKAGDPNPTVRLGVVATVGDRAPVWANLDDYSGVEPLIVDVSWTPDSLGVAYSVQNREQTFLDLDLMPAEGGAPRRILRETTPAWVDNHGSPTWLADGSFLWLSERSGFKHIYRYRRDGSLVRQLTDGRFEARTVHGVDEKAEIVYFSGTERSALGVDVYALKLDGSSLTRLSETPGAHVATFNPARTRYIDAWSDVATPPQVRLHRANGTVVRVIDANPATALSELGLTTPEFLQIKTRDGFAMEAMMIKPPDFDPARRYPVFQHTYAGPHAPQVRNAWGGPTYLFHQMLAQKGIIVWVCDNRSASGKGAESAWPAYKRLGEVELADIEDGILWLRAQPYVDEKRIGLSGWSYGGFMTSYALTHSTSFAMGIAGGSVTDWRNYDSIYTERYMGLPKSNEDGYKRTAPRFSAASLHGDLLLLHGTMDDNVHMQNTLQLAYELQNAGKPFRLMLYPKSRHAVSEPLLVKHLRATMLDFIETTLLR